MKTLHTVDYVSAPADYSELYQRYYHYVVSLVRSMGIPDSRKEDVASDILLRFMERDLLHEFDPTLVFHYKGVDRPARFRTFLTQIVLTYIKGQRDKLRRLTDRELLLCDQQLGGDNETVPWSEVFGDMMPGVDGDTLDLIAEEHTVRVLRQYLQTVPPKSRYDRCPLPLLFDAVVAQIRLTGRWNITSLCAEFSVSPTAMHSWMWWLRANLAAATGRDTPVKQTRVARTRP